MQWEGIFLLGPRRSPDTWTLKKDRNRSRVTEIRGFAVDPGAGVRGGQTSQPTDLTAPARAHPRPLRPCPRFEMGAFAGSRKQAWARRAPGRLPRTRSWSGSCATATADGARQGLGAPSELPRPRQGAQPDPSDVGEPWASSLRTAPRARRCVRGALGPHTSPLHTESRRPSGTGPSPTGPLTWIPHPEPR